MDKNTADVLKYGTVLFLLNRITIAITVMFFLKEGSREWSSFLKLMFHFNFVLFVYSLGVVRKK